MSDPSFSNRKRQFLMQAMYGAGGAAGLGLFPPSIRKALAIPANNRTGTIKDVEHVVILMQENRSFDHYFGTLHGVRGFGDRITIPLPDGRSVWQQTDGKRPILPYHLDQTNGNAQRVSGTPHSWNDARDAWDKGRMTEWPKHKESQSMGYYKEQELPFQFALANAFTICDAYFCSLHGGTNTNRMFLWTGTNGATTEDQRVVVNNAWDSINVADDILRMGYEWTTYPERLEQAGVSWMVYQNMPNNFTDNPLVGFKQYRKANRDSGKPVYHDRKSNPAYAPATDNAGNPLYKGIANTMPDGGFLETFRRDIAAGTLPQVSWVVAPAEYSEHPGSSSPIQGAWYTQEVLDALTANPEVWSKTVLIVNFDENDGFFDHVPPPCAPSLDKNGKMSGRATLVDEDLSYEYFQHNRVLGTFMPLPDKDCYGPGPRVPMYVISPWSRGGWVNSENFDHTSVLRFLEARFGVKESNISPYRRAVFGDLTSAFDFVNPNLDKAPDLLKLEKNAADALRQAQEQLAQVPLPNEYVQTLPQQATGIRPSRALPYEPHVSGRANTSDGTMELVFSNTGSSTCLFHVYDKLHLDRTPRRYVVGPGLQLTDQWQAVAENNGRYDLWVLGPNGFHRHFTGNLNELQPRGTQEPEIRVCYDIANGNVYLDALNPTNEACVFRITANAYFDNGAQWELNVPAGSAETTFWDLSSSGHWYDFTVRIENGRTPAWLRRFAGRVETGKDSISDPAMGTPARN
ncbi:phospholipase C, phosphocholine-specific [Kerstersia gyiorum]|uniref:phosphocholine-specific phospholipase C n=1 Tax=Kerstersia gyiorum TaxID=206506 RepID=UPI0010714A5C|nr:phospholipase C, phosphocholine-specific [Kerstersia gyiorum]QBR40499.1 phospholipase C, phosphocholine-specific [Kerstersia gyiorum]